MCLARISILLRIRPHLPGSALAQLPRCSKPHCSTALEAGRLGSCAPHVSVDRIKFTRTMDARHAEQRFATSAQAADQSPAVHVNIEIPIRVREAAIFLGVSPQTVCLRVERKQIPHLRVMGRNIRFLKPELDPFRAQFKQEVESWQDQ